MRYFLLALMLLLLAVPAAEARLVGFDPPHQVRRSMRLAHQFWADRNITFCAPVMFYKDSLDTKRTDVLAAAPMWGVPCQLVFDRETWRTWLQTIAAGPDGERAAKRERCEVVIHEAGHLGGLDHNPFDRNAIMYPKLDPLNKVQIPYICRLLWPF